MEARVVELEMRMAHYERTLDELNEVIARQQDEIKRLERRVETILHHVREGRQSSQDPGAPSC